MFYQSELMFLKRVLQKFRLQTRELLLSEPLPHDLDLGLRSFLDLQLDYEQLFRSALDRADTSVIYKVTDAFHCNYVFFPLPETAQPTVLMIGPYLTAAPDSQQLLEDAERLGVPPSRFRQLEQCYGSIPLLPNDASMFSILHVFGETVWGSPESFEIRDINQEFFGSAEPLADSRSSSSDDFMLNMKLMERRYAYENELMRIVSQGMIHRADHMLSNFSQLNFEQRMGDPIRNLKNYCIICNTLLRKAAEQGGVHPVYLDASSSSFARKIESVHSLKEGEQLMGDMIRSYCRLVRKHSITRYSGIVQRTIAYIDTDISADLSLHTLSAMQKVSPAHLSTQFKKETGQTLTAHVNEKRIRYALHLLRTTHLQVQSIALHCGIQDPNYFIKVFKKHTGLTPSEYRRHIASEPAETK